MEVEVGSTETVPPIEVVPILPIEEVFILEETITVMDMAMVKVITDTPEPESLTIITEVLEDCLEVEADLLPLEQVQDSWEVPWQVLLQCQCITGTECTRVCCIMAMEVMDMEVTDTAMEAMDIAECYTMNLTVLEVVLCKPFVTMEFVDAGLDMMPGMVNVGKTSMISTITIGMKEKVLGSIPTSPVLTMMFAKKLT